jgi:two-component system, response regulator PdtaR
MHALIIEQDAWIIMMIEDALRDLGYTSFASASSPALAVAEAHSCLPDLITSEIRLGGASGIDAVEQICAATSIPVVFVTATPWEVQEVRPDAVVVPKPFGDGSLKEAVTRAAAMFASAANPV